MCLPSFKKLCVLVEQLVGSSDDSPTWGSRSKCCDSSHHMQTRGALNFVTCFVVDIYSYNISSVSFFKSILQTKWTTYFISACYVSCKSSMQWVWVTTKDISLSFHFEKRQHILYHNTCTRCDANLFPCSLPLTPRGSNNSLLLQNSAFVVIKMGLPQSEFK